MENRLTRCTAGDREALDLLRRLIRNEATAAETAVALFELDPDLDGDVLAASLHIAAEFTSDEAVNDAVAPWLELLGSAEHDQPILSASSLTENLPMSISGGRPRNVTRGVRVPA